MERTSSSAARLAAVYVVVAAGWVFVSDRLIALLPVRVEGALQTVKGLMFVVVTGLVLFLLVQRMFRELGAGARQARSAEVLLDQVVQTAPVGVLFVDEDTVVTFLNPAAETLLSAPMADMVGRRLEELGSVDAQEATAHVSELLRTGAVDGMRLGRPGNVAPRAFIARAKALAPDAGSTGWVVAIADFTDSYRARERSDRLARSYRFFAEAVVSSSRATDHRGMLERVARIATGEGGYRAAWATYSPADDAPFEEVARIGLDRQAADTSELLRERMKTSWPREASAGSAIAISNDLARDPAHPWTTVAEESGLGSSATLYFFVPGRAKGALTVFAQAPGYFDADEIEVLGQLQGAVAFAFEKLVLDSERLAAEEGLERSERGYRELFLGHPVPLWVYDLETLAFLAVNDAAVNKYGWSRDEFVRMHISDIRPASDIGALRDNVARVSEGFEDAGIWTHRDKSGRSFPVQIHSHTIEWAGRSAEMVMAMEIARVG